MLQFKSVFEDLEVANPRSAQCSQCTVGSVPKASRTSCMKCTGQRYALQGDEECRTCTFPAMILGDENWCTILYLILFLVAFLVLVLLVLFLAAVFGRFRLCCFKRRLRAMVEAQDWAQLYATTTSRLEYGVWHRAAEAALQAQKEAVYTGSFQLGISLSYVFDELEAVWPMFPPTIGLRDIEKRFGWSRCTRTQLDPIALIQFNLIVSPERLQRNWLNVSVVAWANQMEPSQRPCTRRKLVKQSGVRIPLVQQRGWDMDLGNVHSAHRNLLESHFQYLQPINDLTVDHMLLVHTCTIKQLLNKNPHYFFIAVIGMGSQCT